MNMKFESFIEEFTEIWASSDIEKLAALISKDYKAREVTSNGQIVDFGYEESIQGWDQGFQYVKESDSSWILKTMWTSSLREDEVMAVISASMNINGKPLETANLFFDTFKQVDGKWMLVRSYVEAGVKAV
ncbi:nuclear transport factor 2 family protein [Rossellomorea vietnamensis]|uniref:Nuclear transport factor 2 family protein n=2 Tax=Rossellomorea vietnamensis TaxID=218284 RepID=A0A5D4KCT4_9BACI|nr:nuclear transport factor 2 family protein [Rossellomorea vietnamensis]